MHVGHMLNHKIDLIIYHSSFLCIVGGTKTRGKGVICCEKQQNLERAISTHAITYLNFGLRLDIEHLTVRP